MSQAELSPAQAHDAEHAHHDHPKWLAHHFDTPNQQNTSAKLGIWVFLGTEILMFGGLFCAYSLWRANHYEAFEFGHVWLSKFWGAFNTLVLIASSFTMAWAVRAIQIGKPKFCFFLMGLTFMGGVGFMIVKSIEYTQKFEHGLGPGAWYVAPAEAAELAKMREEAAGPQAPAAAPAAPPAFGTGLAKPAASPSGMVDPAMRTGAHGHHGSGEPIMVNGREDPYAEMGQTPEDLTIARPFFSIYFAMTALHGLHVLVGMGLIAWVMIRVKSGEFSPEFNTPVDLVGLYWHLVDLIWIFLFPLLYLIH